MKKYLIIGIFAIAAIAIFVISCGKTKVNESSPTSMKSTLREGGVVYTSRLSDTTKCDITIYRNEDASVDYGYRVTNIALNDTLKYITYSQDTDIKIQGDTLAILTFNEHETYYFIPFDDTETPIKETAGGGDADFSRECCGGGGGCTLMTTIRGGNVHVECFLGSCGSSCGLNGRYGRNVTGVYVIASEVHLIY